MPLFTDQAGNTINLTKVPQRIVSLVPSQTELLYDLGLDAEVIGITKFCIHPNKWFNNKQRVGGTKTIDIEKIKNLQPDLIIANKEENVKEQVGALQQIAPVWVSDITNLQQALEMINSIGSMIDRQKKALTMTESIEASFNHLSATITSPSVKNIPSAYFIWRNPYMAAGGDTFINDIMLRSGFQNVFVQRDRYPEISLSDIKQSGCHLLLLSSEPYPFKQQHIQEIQKALPYLKIMLVDGEMFSWYGSRLLHTADYLVRLRKDIEAYKVN